MRVGSARNKAVAYVWALCIGLVVVFSAYFSTTAYAADVTTPFDGDLQNVSGKTIFRPKMPGDVAYDADLVYANWYFDATWFYHSNTTCSGDPSGTAVWKGVAKKDENHPPAEQCEPDESNPGDNAYKRNYFVRKLTPSVSGK